MSTPPRISKFEKETFMFICLDGKSTPPLRAKYLFGHLEYIEANHEHYRVAGPMRRTVDGDIYGSFFLVEAENEDAAWVFMRGDPYVASNMYESITVSHVTPACGALIGGVIWDQDEIRANMEKYAKG